MYKKKKKQRKLLRRELVSNRKYHTKYKDIKKYFTLINREVFNNELSPFGKIEIKEIRDRIKYCYGLVEVLEWERKGTRIYRLQMQPTYRNKKEFVDTLGHEMVHLYQMANKGDTGNHNKLFYSFRPKLNRIGLDL
jgi:Iap family predicted aminopeptidase